MHNNRPPIRTTAQKIKNEKNPQGNMSDEEIKSELERVILDRVKKIAQGFSAGNSLYTLVSDAKELLAIEDKIAEETKKNKPAPSSGK